MATRYDIHNTERQYLLDFLDVEGSDILEIGCGEGRLTWKYADLASTVTGIDLVPLQDALNNRPDDLRDRVRFVAASALDLPFANYAFDHVVFAWSF